MTSLTESVSCNSHLICLRSQMQVFVAQLCSSFT
jgi:hypothetical protein